MPTVRLGNPNAINHATGEAVAGEQITTVSLPEEWPLDAQIRAVVANGGPTAQGAWAAHSAGSPSWVASDAPVLAQAIAAHYGCPIGQPAVTAQEG